jgi:heme exporter protein C
MDNSISPRFTWLPLTWLPLVALLCGPALVLGQYLVWAYAPVEQTMGDAQKIFYVHVPLAWWGLIAFFTVFVSGILYLWKRNPFFDQLAGVAAETGVLFAGLALITGSLWARSSWGVWWTWDPRLTTTLIMWFVYAGYLVVRVAGVGGERGAAIRAVLGIAAFLDVPLVFLSARLWRGIHPEAMASGGGLEPEMLTTLLVCLGGWGLMWLCLMGIRLRQTLLRARIEAAEATEEG